MRYSLELTLFLIIFPVIYDVGEGSRLDKIEIHKKILSKNDDIAADLRLNFKKNKILVLNLVSSPGSGKTSLLERTLRVMQDRLKMAVIAGDVQTENDARRLLDTGVSNIRPIVTGGACHLDARVISDALANMDIKDIELLFIENVGNLVCPASFDLGEDMKVVLVSVTEGDDKPLKYPAMFRHASVCIWNKIDLLNHTDFDMECAKQNAHNINADLKMFDISCRTEDGMANWYTWLLNQVAKKRGGYPEK